MGVEGFTCNLKKYRLLKDMTQEQLANAVGVRRETIMRLEKALPEAGDRYFQGGGGTYRGDICV